MQERIGIIFVHGIGEQRRFDHLDWQIRPLLDALIRRPHTELTVEIVGAPASTLQAQQDTWSTTGGGPVRAIVRDTETREDRELVFHEVWWADVNEPYSLWKQVKFWFWGLSVWAVPRQKKDSPLAGAEAMQPPAFPGRFSQVRRFLNGCMLFGISNVFLLGALSIGLVTFLAKRLLDLSLPDRVRVLVNYVSAVKLYSQSRRADGGFLDAYHEPPRVSVRRRMIRTMADVACENYSRWYVVAHSLGSVVAYNGLMETGHCMANYLDEARWKKLLGAGFGKGFAGSKREGDYVTPQPPMMPPRPAWLEWEELVYRDRLLANFRGLFTYGSPLDKFAFIWPPRVPINKAEPMFPNKAEWVNVYDPTDPVSAPLDAFSQQIERLIKPVNYGYRASWALLWSHLRYFKCGHRGSNELSDLVTGWILQGNSFTGTHNPGAPPFYKPGSSSDRLRGVAAIGMWIAVYLVMAGAGAAVVRTLFNLFANLFMPVERSLWQPLVLAPHWWPAIPGGQFVFEVALLIAAAAFLTLLFGGLHHLKLARDENVLEKRVTPNRST